MGCASLGARFICGEACFRRVGRDKFLTDQAEARGDSFQILIKIGTERARVSVEGGLYSARLSVEGDGSLKRRDVAAESGPSTEGRRFAMMGANRALSGSRLALAARAG